MTWCHIVTMLPNMTYNKKKRYNFVTSFVGICTGKNLKTFLRKENTDWEWLLVSKEIFFEEKPLILKFLHNSPSSKWTYLEYFWEKTLIVTIWDTERLSVGKLPTCTKSLNWVIILITLSWWISTLISILFDNADWIISSKLFNAYKSTYWKTSNTRVNYIFKELSDILSDGIYKFPL